MNLESATVMLNEMNVGRIYSDNDVKVVNDVIKVEKCIIENDKNISLKWLDEKFSREYKTDDIDVAIVHPLEQNEIIQGFDRLKNLSDNKIFIVDENKPEELSQKNNSDDLDQGDEIKNLNEGNDELEKNVLDEEIKSSVGDICQNVEVQDKVEDNNYGFSNEAEDANGSGDSWSFFEEKEEYIPVIGKVYDFNEKDHGVRCKK